jgi:hypothetical protein
MDDAVKNQTRTAKLTEAAAEALRSFKYAMTEGSRQQPYSDRR